MPNNETSIQIPAAPPAAASTATVGIRTFRIRDSTTGQLVQVQGVVVCDDDGEAMVPLSERTGREILRTLQSLLGVQAQATGMFPVNEPGHTDGG